jgi:hypothetical protein
MPNRAALAIYRAGERLGRLVSAGIGFLVAYDLGS